MELNKEQVIKALECCGTSKKSCSSCPLAKDYSPCSKTMADNALALITSQEQRIKELGEDVAIKVMTLVEFDKRIERLTEENERLRAENENKCKDCAGCLQWKLDCANIEAYAVEKYKSAIIEYYSKPKYQPTKEHPIKHTQIEYLFAVLDQIAKEMLEGEK